MQGVHDINLDIVGQRLVAAVPVRHAVLLTKTLCRLDRARADGHEFSIGKPQQALGKFMPFIAVSIKCASGLCVLALLSLRPAPTNDSRSNYRSEP